MSHTQFSKDNVSINRIASKFSYVVLAALLTKKADNFSGQACYRVCYQYYQLL